MELTVGTIITGKVTTITKFGAFVALPGGKSGLVHISEVSGSFVTDVHDFLTEGQEVPVRVLSISPEGKISLSVKQAQPPKPRTLKELAAAQDAGQPLTPEETERLEASRSRKKNAYQELKAQAETDPAAAVELARRRAYHSEATKKSRQKMYEEAAAGNPEAQARYENFLAARRENYHRKKHDEKGEQIA